MLEYGLPETPGTNQRWFIKASGQEYRYLHLQQRVNLLGIKFWYTVHKDMIHTGRHADSFEIETRNAAHDVLRELRVNFNLPTGEVR